MYTSVDQLRNKPKFDFSESPICLIDYDPSVIEFGRLSLLISENEKRIELEKNKTYRIKMFMTPHIFNNGRFAMMVIDRTEKSKIRLLEGKAIYLNEFLLFDFLTKETYDWDVTKIEFPGCEAVFDVTVGEPTRSALSEEEPSLIKKYWINVAFTYEPPFI